MPAPVQIPVNEKPTPIDNTRLVEDFRRDGGGIIHIRPKKIDTKSSVLTRGMTFAYKRRGSRVEFSTAVQHRNDPFCKKIGTKLAIDHFLTGKTVTFPLNNKRKVEVFFDDLAYWATR